MLLNYTAPFYQSGAGTYDCAVRNSIVETNFHNLLSLDNYGYSGFYSGSKYIYSCTFPLFGGTGNIDGESAWLDLFHLSSNSACRGAGNAAYASGVDLDGEPWASPPSTGCDEVVPANLLGPLSVSLMAQETTLLVGHVGFFAGRLTGRAAYVAWSFADGQLSQTWVAVPLIHGPRLGITRSISQPSTTTTPAAWAPACWCMWCP